MKSTTGRFITLLSAVTIFFGIASNTQAAECTIDSPTLNRGQHKLFYICSRDITADYSLDGLAPDNIAITYDQYLRRCSSDDNRHGVFLWLKAAADAQSTTLNVINNGGDALCDPIAIDVPDRVVVNDVVLKASKRSASAIHLLEIRAGANQDLSSACKAGIRFPEWGQEQSRWPILKLLTPSEMDDVPRDLGNHKRPLSCSNHLIRALVKVEGQQREATPIIISNVEYKSGGQQEGITYVTLPEPAWANAMADEDAKFIDVDGIRTRYWDKGKGPALLLLHGGQPTGKAGGALTWVRNFDGLAEKFHVYAIDRIGQGLTDNLKKEDDYNRYYDHVIDHVWGFINAAGIKRVGLVGHSQGGWPVSRLALDHPDRVSCVVNVDGVLAPGGPEALHTARYYMHTTQFHPPNGETVQSIHRTREFQSHTLNNLTVAGARRGFALAQLPKLDEATVIMERLQMSPRHPHAQSLFDQARLDIAAGMLKVPSLVIWGYNDPSSPFSGGLALFELINAVTPVSEMHVFANSGHASHVEYPERFNHVVADFCGRYP